jgi:hypothetical protein
VTHDPFSDDELTRGYWLKVGRHGRSLVIEFRQRGQCQEGDLFSFTLPLQHPSPKLPPPSRWWDGTWQRSDSRLIVIVASYELTVLPLAIFPGIYEGVERNRENPDYSVNFRLIHAQGAT